MSGGHLSLSCVLNWLLREKCSHAGAYNACIVRCCPAKPPATALPATQNTLWAPYTDLQAACVVVASGTSAHVPVLPVCACSQHVVLPVVATSCITRQCGAKYACILSRSAASLDGLLLLLLCDSLQDASSTCTHQTRTPCCCCHLLLSSSLAASTAVHYHLLVLLQFLGGCSSVRDQGACGAAWNWEVDVVAQALIQWCGDECKCPGEQQ